MNFREIQPRDLPAIFEVRVATWHNDRGREEMTNLGITEKSVRVMLEESHRGWLCEVGGRPVGFAMGNRKTGEMWVIAVLREFEGRGIGRRLLTLVQDWLWSEGWREIWLTTDTDESLRAVGFYRHLGWSDWKIKGGDRFMRKAHSPGGEADSPKSDRRRTFGTIAFIAAALSVLPVRGGTVDCFADAEPLEVFLKESFSASAGGMVVGLVDGNGRRVFSSGKQNGETVFEIGSVTKTFTSLLALDLDRDGTWKLDEPVSKHLPEGVTIPSFEGKPITLRHLAAQDSGLPFNADNLEDEEAGVPYNRYTTRNLYAFLTSHRLTSAPGTRFGYSNVGMSLLGHAMERATGKSFEALALSRICRPLGMDDTRITLTPEMKSRLATGHAADGKPAPYYDLKVMAGAGALKSTANDMLTFLSAQLGRTESDLAPLMRESQVIRHTGAPSLGRSAMPWVDWNCSRPPDSDLFAHSGGTPGFSAFIGFDRKRHRGVVVLTNQRMMSSVPVGLRILQDMPLAQDP